MNTLQLINFGSRELSRKKIDSCILDSELLLSKILNKKREEILTNLNQKIYPKHLINYKKLIVRRSKNEPIAYITKEKEFWSKKFFVNQDTLIPRPETELMVEKLINIYNSHHIHTSLHSSHIYNGDFHLFENHSNSAPTRLGILI